jgi:hypothetical protein
MSTYDYGNFRSAAVGTTPTTVLGPVATGDYAIITGLSLCNITSSNVNVTVDVKASGTSYSVVPGSLLQVGQSLTPVEYDSKLVLVPGDELVVTSSSAASVTVLGGVITKTV